MKGSSPSSVHLLCAEKNLRDHIHDDKPSNYFIITVTNAVRITEDLHLKGGARHDYLKGRGKDQRMFLRPYRKFNVPLELLPKDSH